MIATALTFLLGIFIALLAALLLAPVLWRKAKRFARREFEATIPVTANEIRAEFDRVRAEAAMAVRRQEIETKEMAARLASARAETGRAHVELAALQRRERELERQMANFTMERDNVRQTFAAYRDKERLLNETLSEVQRDGSLTAEELEALAVKFREVSDLAEDRMIELVAAETKIERLTDTLRSVERASVEKDTLIRLLRHEAGKAADEKPRGHAKSGIIPGLVVRAADRPPHDAGAPPRAAGAEEHPRRDGLSGLHEILDRAHAGRALSAAEEAQMRETIADVASQVIYRTALREGEASPLAPLLDPAADAPARSDREPATLAERVRRLAGAGQARGKDMRAE